MRRGKGRPTEGGRNLKRSAVDKGTNKRSAAPRKTMARGRVGRKGRNG